MRVHFQRRVKGQTALGIFQNVFTRCESLKYVAFHLGTWRLTVSWGWSR